MLVTKANVVEKENKRAARLYHQHNPSIHVTGSTTVTSLSASLQQRISVAMDCLCQIVVNWTLLQKFEKWCKFSTVLKRNCTKCNCIK